MDKEDTKPATSLCMDKENKPTTLLPCDRCHVVPGTVVDFSHWFAQMASYKCMKCGEMRALFETPEGIDILQDCEYASDVLEDQGSDPETYLAGFRPGSLDKNPKIKSETKNITTV